MFWFSAANYVKSKGVRLVSKNDFMINIFHIFAEVLYEANINEQEEWQPGQYYLSSLNFGSLASHASFEVEGLYTVIWLQLHFIYRMYSSMIHILETRDQTFLNQWQMAVTTASGWFTTGLTDHESSLDLKASLWKESSIPNTCVCPQPNLYWKERRQTKLSWHKPGLHVYGRFCGFNMRYQH